MKLNEKSKRIKKLTLRWFAINCGSKNWNELKKKNLTFSHKDLEDITNISLELSQLNKNKLNREEKFSRNVKNGNIKWA